MPNRCYTVLVFHGNDKEITDFRYKLEEYTSKNYMENGFGPTWLGNVLCGAGLGDHIDSKVDCIRCRGAVEWIDDIESNGDDDSMLRVAMTSAWSPAISMWTRVISALKYETIIFTFCAEEPGCELYAKYDPLGDFDDKYYVDTLLCGEDGNNKDLCRIQDTRYYASDEHLIEDLQRLLESTEVNIKNLIAKAHMSTFADEDSYISIHTYEDVNLEDCD